MGLDVTAYSNLEQIDSLPDVEEWEDQYWMKDHDATTYTHGGTVAYSNKHFPGSALGLPADECAVFRFDESYAFRAGSYSGYNYWRAWLSQRALAALPHAIWENPARFEGKPFVELVNFSDCEGYIGPIAAKKLAKDFQDHAEDAAAWAASDENSDWLLKKYRDWTKAFELAADGGMVRFH